MTERPKIATIDDYRASVSPAAKLILEDLRANSCERTALTVAGRSALG